MRRISGCSMAVTKVDDAQHLVRLVKPKDLRRDENGEVIGINASTFDLREGETYLSASCLEVAGRDKPAALRALHGFFDARFSRISKHAFSVGLAGDVKSVCSKRSSVRLLCEPKLWNPAYAAVRGFPGDDLEIKEQLAAQHWKELHLLSKFKPS